MASSFIDYNGEYGFWAHDSVVEVMQYLIIDEIHKSVEYNEFWLEEFKLELAIQSMPVIAGGMSMKLNEFITDQKRKNILLDFIHHIEDKLKSKSLKLTNRYLLDQRRKAINILAHSKRVNLKSEEIDQIVHNSYWSDSDQLLDNNRYLRGFQLLRELLQSELTYFASSPIDYWEKPM